MPDLTPLDCYASRLVCVGSGGVGKTTTAAALALWGALHGRRTAVVTIDPAKRLADCLGLNTIGCARSTAPARNVRSIWFVTERDVDCFARRPTKCLGRGYCRYAPTAKSASAFSQTAFIRAITHLRRLA